VTPATNASLRQLQRWFAAVASQPEGVSSDSRRSRQLERLVTPGPRLSAVERLRIYNDGYFARLIECLTDDYPALAYALGDDAFHDLCRGYIAEQPSRSPSLNGYGAGLARHCRTRPEPWAAFAADLACLEWALVEVVHEPLEPCLQAEALAEVQPTRLATARLVKSPALRVLVLDHPVNAFYRAFREDTTPAPPGLARAAVAVYRSGLSLWRLDLEPRAALLLQDLLRGLTLEQAVAGAAHRAGGADGALELARRLPQWLGTWVREGFFRSIALG